MMGFIKKLPIHRKSLADIEPQILNYFLFCNFHSNGKRPLSRCFFTRQMNEILKQTPELRSVHLTSHSFRRGYITFLWDLTKDAEFVRQVTSHLSLDVLTGYIAKLSDKENETA